MFSRVLIANRGEIALRLARGLRDLKIKSVAVYNSGDQKAPHVRAADFAYPLSQPGAAGYLDQARLLQIATEAKCDAVLPGYGFLSENADFAQACADSDLCFVGPSPDAIRTMGDKLAARRVMARAGVPLVPGGDAPSVADAEKVATAVGYPVLLKAAHGGGGKGMRLVHSASELPAAYAMAESESDRAFGSGVIYVEKALLGARHVEVQVLADQHGNAVHLFERDCSIQRRHQKVVEETPSPQLSKETLHAMTAAAISAVAEVNYFSAGTLEFLVDQNQNFFFLEMNTRLQVEHTVTEMVTGIDLVEQMLLVAAGSKLSFTQDDIERRGHAIQCRIYAEDPETGFLPSSGTISQISEPSGPHVRLDSGIREGHEVTSEFDPLLAKLCVWGPSRAQAIARLARALSEFQFLGPKTNLGFHSRLLSSPDFCSGHYDTGFIEAHPELLNNPQGLSPQSLSAAAAVAQLRGPEKAVVEPRSSSWRSAGRSWKTS